MVKLTEYGLIRRIEITSLRSDDNIVEVKEKLLDIIKEINPYVEIDVDTKLLDEEILDSMSFLLMLNEIESEFNVHIPAESVNAENYKDVNTIANYIQSIM